MQCPAGRVFRDLQESLQFITLQCFLHARLHKLTKVSVCVSAFKQIWFCMFRGGRYSVSFFVCCLGDVTAAARTGFHISTDLHHFSTPYSMCRLWNYLLGYGLFQLQSKTSKNSFTVNSKTVVPCSCTMICFFLFPSITSAMMTGSE